MSNSVSFEIRVYGNDDSKKRFRESLSWLEEMAVLDEKGGFIGFEGSVPGSCLSDVDWQELSGKYSLAIGVAKGSYMDNSWSVEAVKDGNLLHYDYDRYFSVSDVYGMEAKYLDLLGTEEGQRPDGQALEDFTSGCRISSEDADRGEKEAYDSLFGIED